MMPLRCAPFKAALQFCRQDISQWVRKATTRSFQFILTGSFFEHLSVGMVLLVFFVSSLIAEGFNVPLTPEDSSVLLAGLAALCFGLILGLTDLVYCMGLVSTLRSRDFAAFIDPLTVLIGLEALTGLTVTVRSLLFAGGGAAPTMARAASAVIATMRLKRIVRLGLMDD